MAKGKFPLIPIDEALSADVEDDVVAINRSAAVVKGGRRFSFSALSVVGNRNGLVGIGYGKANEVPNAIEKSVKDARKQIMRVIRNGSTILRIPGRRPDAATRARSACSSRSACAQNSPPPMAT